MWMQQYLQGAAIKAIQQVENDRISLVRTNGDSVAVTLSKHGKHSNIILIRQVKITAIKHVGFSQNSYRTIYLGSTYVVPPYKSQSSHCYDEKLLEISCKTGENRAQTLQQIFQGLGRGYATSSVVVLLINSKLFLEYLPVRSDQNPSASAIFRQQRPKCPHHPSF